MERLNQSAKEPSSPSSTTGGASPSPTGAMEKEKKLPTPIEANLGSLCIGSSSPSRELEAQEHTTTTTTTITSFSTPSPNNNTSTSSNTNTNTIKFPITHHHNNKHANSSSSNNSSTSSTNTTPSHNNSSSNNKHSSSNSSSTASSSTTNLRIASTPPHRVGNDSASSHSPSGTTTPPPLMHTPRQLLPSLTPCPLSDLVFVLPGVGVEEEEDYPSSVAKRNSAQTPPNTLFPPSPFSPIPSNTQTHIPTRIYAHKTIISERSEYFRVLLTNGMRESSQHEITIPNIDPNIFLSVLRFVYTGELPLTEDTINPLFEACDQFLLESGKNICRTYITQHMPNEVLARFLFEHHTLCSELGSLYLQQAIENAPYFLQSPCVGLLPKDALIRMLHSNDMPLKEIEVFRGVREWIKTNVRIESPPIPSSSPSSSPPSRTPTLPLSPKYYCGPEVLDEIFSLLRFPLMDYDELRNEVESLNLVPANLLLEAYRFLAKPKTIPLNEFEVGQVRFTSRKKPDPSLPGTEVHTFQCREHERCTAVAWPVTHFSSIKTQKHLSNTFDVRGLRWRMWAYPAGEAKHAGSFSVYLEAVRVKERESYDFLRNTTFFFALVNHRNPALSRQYPSTPNVLFNYEKSVWGNGLIELKLLYDKSLGYIESDMVSVHLHLLECIALEG